MLLDLQKDSHQELIEAMLWRRVPNCKKIHKVEHLTGGASRQMFKAHVQTDKEDLVLVLRKLAGGDGEIDQLSLPQEVAVMRAVIDAGVKTPYVHFEFKPEDGLGEGYAMEFLEGETLGGRIARSKKFVEARKKLTAQTGEMLAKVHSIDIKATRLNNLLPTFTPEYVADSMYSIYQTNKVEIPMLEYTYKWLKDHLPPPAMPVLTHGDFRNGNLLVDPNEGLLGILDWELGALSDPMRDVAYFCLTPWRYGVGHLEAGGFGTKEEFFQAYESTSGIRVDRERFKWWQVFSCFWWSIACVAMGLSYRQVEGKLGDRIAIGRRHTEGLIDLINLLIPGTIKLPTSSPSNNEHQVATLAELIQSTQKDIMKVILPTVNGKSLFVSRVAINNLGIALREMEFGGIRDQAEIKSTNELLQESFNDVIDCRKKLCEVLLKDDWPFSKNNLEEHLRHTIARQIAIDQPTYSGLAQALKVSKN